MPIQFGSSSIPDSEIALQTDHFYFLQRSMPVLKNSGIIIPKRFITTPFDFTQAEWIDLQQAILLAKSHVDAQCSPDGYNLGWNVGPIAGQEVKHVHLHIIPRFADEPMAGKGIRAHLKHESNRRAPLG